jgi:hypothetical protein
MNGLKGAIDAQGALACSSSDGLSEDVQAFANYWMVLMRLNVSAIKGGEGVD